MIHSFAYGLRLGSNLPIPGLAPSEPFAVPDVHIELGIALDEAVSACAIETRDVSPWRTSAGVPLVTIGVCTATGQHLWAYEDGLRFVVDAAGRHIRADWTSASTIGDAALSLLGPVLGFVLRLRGITCLHASAIAIDGKAIALLGRPTVGKSTTAAALMMLGYPLVSEDVVPLIDRGAFYEVVPGYPVVRLWPEAAEFLCGPEAELPLLTESRDKRRLDVIDRGYRFQRDPLPLGAIYYLTKRSDDDRAPFVEPAGGPAALGTLIGETYTNYALSREMRAQEFALLGALTRRVPVRSVTAHNDPARLPRLCEAILHDFATLAVADPAPVQ
jgi:hypothetical protein